MFLYQIKLDNLEGFSNSNEVYPAVLLQHEKEFTQEQFQHYIDLAKREDYCTFSGIWKPLEKYGFKRLITGYYE